MFVQPSSQGGTLTRTYVSANVTVIPTPTVLLQLYDGFGSKLTRLNKVFRGRRSAEELTKCQGCKVLVLKLKDVWQASKQAS